MEAIGFVLGQVLDNKEVAIAYGGRQLSKTEQRHSTTERHLQLLTELRNMSRICMAENQFSSTPTIICCAG